MLSRQSNWFKEPLFEGPLINYGNALQEAIVFQ